MSENVEQGTIRYNTNAVKEWLRSYFDMKEDIRLMQEEYSILEMELESVGSPVLSDMPKSKSSVMDREASRIAQKLDLENDIEQANRDLEVLRKEIEAEIKRLKKPDQKAVIRVRYLLCKSKWEDVSFVLFGNKPDYCEKVESYLRRTHKIHKSALISMAKNRRDVRF